MLEYLLTLIFVIRAYNNERDLQRHRQRAHDPKREFKCDICGAVKHTLEELNLHGRHSHPKERSYPCPHCPYSGK